MNKIFLSRLILNPQSRQAQRDIADPYNLHCTIMAAFGPKRDAASVLHRLDNNPRTGAMVLLVQSLTEPDWNSLHEKDYLLMIDPFDPVPNPAVKCFDIPLRPNQLLSFRLRANPTIKKVRRDEQGKRLNSNRVPLVREEKQIQWLENRSRESGFQIVQVTVNQSQKQSGRQPDNDSPITVYTVQFDGRLQVTDPDKLRDAVTVGIGPAKAFGCGLLSLAPA